MEKRGKKERKAKDGREQTRMSQAAAREERAGRQGEGRRPAGIARK